MLSLSPDVSKQIRKKMDTYAQNPPVHKPTWVKAVKKTEFYRIVIKKKWRVIFKETDTEIVIVKIGHRDDVYKNLDNL